MRLPSLVSLACLLTISMAMGCASTKDAAQQALSSPQVRVQARLLRLDDDIIQNYHPRLRAQLANDPTTLTGPNRPVVELDPLQVNLLVTAAQGSARGYSFTFGRMTFDADRLDEQAVGRVFASNGMKEPPRPTAKLSVNGEMVEDRLLFSMRVRIEAADEAKAEWNDAEQAIAAAIHAVEAELNLAMAKEAMVLVELPFSGPMIETLFHVQQDDGSASRVFLIVISEIAKQPQQ